MSATRILIFANGELPDLDAARRLIRPDDFVICADGGTRHARALGLEPAMLVGDLDSLEPVQAGRPLARGVDLRQYPADKDETDLELALKHALEREPSSIVIVGGLGARIDHTLGNIGLLLDPRLVGRETCLDDGVERVLLCRDQVFIQGVPGDLVSLIPWGGPVAGARTHGLRWPLKGETLLAERARGISNEMLERTAGIQVESGLLLVVHRRVAESVHQPRKD